MNTETDGLSDYEMLSLRASKDCTPNLDAWITHNPTQRNLCGNITERVDYSNARALQSFLFSKILNSQA
jgi:hypothetical protein